MKNKLLIIGAGGHGKVVADIALLMNKWRNIAILDDDETIKTSMRLEVIGRSADVYIYISDYDIFVAIGNNKIREKIQSQIEILGASIATLIHPSAIIGSEVEVGVGTVVMANAVINCCSRIGEGCIVNTGATVDHDNVIKDYVHISPGAHLAGMVSVGKGTWLGIGSVISNNVNITSGCKVGAGSVVIKDINDAGTYVGIPARRV